ncbi:hypothetical protein MJG53_012494 [Ovis ammon polii x Ovis aries]|uniref:Uncharacterized protein n=1 Tax=Ovis ammon polii x Ovis aries TaxID=2918886 RepID=A0ACB9UNQ5_9CETA|nr:hypothetical protein MJG53_012494 [Ovis ammon polii x Ovis aries]
MTPDVGTRHSVVWLLIPECHPGEAESGPNIPPAQVSPEMEASKQDECLGSIERNRGFGSGLRKTQSPEGPGFASVYPSDVSPPYHDICYTASVKTGPLRSESSTGLPTGLQSAEQHPGLPEKPDSINARRRSESCSHESPDVCVLICQSACGDPCECLPEWLGLPAATPPRVHNHTLTAHV